MIKQGQIGVVLCLLLAGCGSSEGVTSAREVMDQAFADLGAVAERTAGRAAIDCGVAELGDDHSPVNCCLADKHLHALPAYAIYQLQGIDSLGAIALTTDRSGTVFSIHIDGQYGNFEEHGENRIVSSECKSPRLQDNTCSDPEGFPFDCDLGVRPN